MLKSLRLKLWLVSKLCLTKLLFVFPGGWHRGVMVKAMDCEFIVNEFELQSRYYVHFRANTLQKGMKLLSSQKWVKLYHYYFVFFKN